MLLKKKKKKQPLKVTSPQTIPSTGASKKGLKCLLIFTIANTITKGFIAHTFDSLASLGKENYCPVHIAKCFTNETQKKEKS